jgi:hypothetical protein
MLDEGRANPTVGAAWSRMPKSESSANPLP